MHNALNESVLDNIDASKLNASDEIVRNANNTIWDSHQEHYQFMLVATV
jgi:hypothetical protein